MVNGETKCDIAYSRILVNSKKKWNTNAFYNIDEPQKYAKRKKTVTEVFILCNSIYMKCPEKANL